MFPTKTIPNQKNLRVKLFKTLNTNFLAIINKQYVTGESSYLALVLVTPGEYGLKKQYEQTPVRARFECIT